MSISPPFTMTINGNSATAVESFQVINPATEEKIADVADATQAQLDEAVAAARAAFPTWKSIPLAERQDLVRQLGDRLAEHADAFAALLTREQGKPLSEAKAEIGSAVYWLHETAKLAPPMEIVSEDAERRIEMRHTPVGVIGAISPWNFPVALAIWKIAPALVAGNTLVLKPSPFTPLTSLKLGELARDLLPPGVFNVISGTDRLGPWLTEHPDIDKIAFTGSTQTGKAIMRSASGSLKRITLELGGNDPAVVLPDVDVEALVPRLFWSAFGNNAQICVATKRLYVHEAIYDRFAKALVDYARTVRTGDGSKPESQLGPVQNKLQYERVSKLLANARDTGVKFLLGGEVPHGKGYFIPVAIADNPPDDHPVVAEEAFGPVLPLLKFKDVDEVVRRANDTIYGLAASVWGQDLDLAQSVADRLDAGTVWVNTSLELSPYYAFGGHKQSGLGVENGLAGLLEYTNPQTVIVRRKAQPIPA